MNIGDRCVYSSKHGRAFVSSGFTLVEVLLVVGLLGVMAGLFVVIDNSAIVQNDVDIGAETVVESLRRARTLAIASEGDSTWGVYIEDGSITVFKGNGYSVRDSQFDEIFDLPGSVSVAGAQEFVFRQVWGRPVESGELTLTTNSNFSQTIRVNDHGIAFH